MTSRSKAEVLRKLAVLNAAAVRADSGRDTSTRAWLEAWLANLGPARRSANTLASYRWAFEKWVAPTLGDVPLRSLGPADLERVWRLMAAEGLSANSIKAAKSAVSAALSDAQRRGLVDRQAAQLSQVPHYAPRASSQRRGSARAIQSLTQDEVDRLVATASEIGHPYEAMVLMGATRGLRPGELTGLVWEDIDFETSTVYVHRARIEEGAAARRGRTKTKASERPLKMPEEVMEALARRRARWEQERERAGKQWEGLDLVFCTQTGGFVKRRNLERRFEVLGKRAHVEGLTPYLLRHRTASLLAEEGIPREGLAELLGHTST